LIEQNEPLGCIAIICDSKSNHPLLSFILHLVSAIAYGNTMIIIPDERMPLPALDVYEIFETSDIPDGVINILTGNKQHLAKYLCEHQQVKSIWYLYDEKSLESELTSLRFLKHCSNFSLKQTWLVSSQIPMNSEDVSRSYFNELLFKSTQAKFIHIPIGTIFAN
jgi:aldehyde dehydrogenase (NAD+)